MSECELVYVGGAIEHLYKTSQAYEDEIDAIAAAIASGRDCRITKEDIDTAVNEWVDRKVGQREREKQVNQRKQDEQAKTKQKGTTP